MPAILSRLYILFINYISLDLDNIEVLSNKLSVWYLVVKPACENAALSSALTHYKIGHYKYLINLFR